MVATQAQLEATKTNRYLVLGSIELSEEASEVIKSTKISDVTQLLNKRRGIHDSIGSSNSKPLPSLMWKNWRLSRYG